jgi:hypothetical protein
VSQKPTDTSTLGGFAQAAKCTYYLYLNCPFFCLVTPSNISVATTGWIFVKFDIGALTKNLSRKSNFDQIREKISDILHEDLSTGFCCQVYKIGVKVLSSSKITSGWQGSTVEVKILCER